MKSQSGFTLIELVVVIVILGILAAIAVPKYVDLSDQATTAAKKGIKGNIKSAWAIQVAKNAANSAPTIYPTVAALAGAMEDGSATEVATGIQVTIDGGTYVLQTYYDKDGDGTCEAGVADDATAATTDIVQCIGDWDI